MKPRMHDPRRLDIAAAAEQGAELQGEWPLAALQRLVEGSPPKAADEVVSWSARFTRRAVPGGRPEARLHLQAQARVQRDCQRCLQPVAIDVTVDRALRFVADEATAAALDADSEEDVLAAERAFDLQELVEDELLLALPLVPRHEVCPQPLPLTGEAGESADAAPAHPFAALAALKPRGSA